MTYSLLMGTLNPTHSLTQCVSRHWHHMSKTSIVISKLLGYVPSLGSVQNYWKLERTKLCIEAPDVTTERIHAYS